MSVRASLILWALRLYHEEKISRCAYDHWRALESTMSQSAGSNRFLFDQIAHLDPVTAEIIGTDLLVNVSKPVGVN